MEVYATLNDFIKEANTMDAPILPGLKMLLPEYVKYSISRLSSYFPPLLPSSILSEEVKTGEINPKLWIPIEDLYDGWQKNGQVGQEVYGAGVGFGIVPRQYVKVKNEDFIIFTEYPTTKPRNTGNKSLAFSVIGDSRFESLLRIISDNKTSLPTFSMTVNGKQDEDLKPQKTSSTVVEYKITGGSRIKLTWK